MFTFKYLNFYYAHKQHKSWREYLNLSENMPLNLDKCVGCSACKQICPMGAIEMIANNEGFLYPFINKSKCINCGACSRVCPLNSELIKKEPQCYAVAGIDELREKSSSGGLFTLFASEIIKKGGVVCGAAFDEEFKVKHIIVDNLNDLDKLRGSKYVQSDIGDSYKKIKDYLNNDRYVFFTGTPCQVSGLYNYLEGDSEYLFTADLLCHGVPSPKIFKKFLDEIGGVKNISKIQFRDKEKGWKGVHFSYTTIDDQKIFFVKLHI